jgi:hypothetical protein
MFDDLEGTHGIIGPPVLDKMPLQRLIEGTFDAVVRR